MKLVSLVILIDVYDIYFQKGVDQGGIYGRDSIMAVNKVKDRIKEGQHINKSLFFLTQVISLKSEGKR